MKVEFLELEEFAKQFENEPKEQIIKLLYQSCIERIEITNEKAKVQGNWYSLKKWLQGYKKYRNKLRYILVNDVIEKVQELEEK